MMTIEIDTKIEIPYVCEHDIDILFLEEITASPSFLKWLLAKVAKPGPAHLISVAYSVSTSTGESDLEFFVHARGKTHGVLVEDKLNAGLQPGQAERYQKRASDYIRRGKCDECTTVIIAPRAYFADEQGAKGFDHRIHLEDVLDWFSRSKISKVRKRYILALLGAGLERGCVGWRLIPDRTVTDFWHKYWELADCEAPELQMPKPSDRPSGSTWIYFKPHDLPKNVQLVHKLMPGFMDLQFGGMGDKTAELERRYKRRLGKGMRIDRATKSGVIRIRVPEIDISKPSSSSEPGLRQALKQGIRLLRWYRRVTQMKPDGGTKPGIQ